MPFMFPALVLTADRTDKKEQNRQGRNNMLESPEGFALIKSLADDQNLIATPILRVVALLLS
jgi:hypothetical protein